jgi:Cys-tRNA(Pro) deacylase
MASTAVERFRAHAEQHGIDVEVVEFPQETRTAQAAADAIGCDVAQIVKSLVFMADERPVLALTSGANRVDEGKLAAILGATEVRKADADEVRAATGYAIGGTPPFGHTNHLDVVCDRDLTRFDPVWAAAGLPTTVFAIRPEVLLDVTGAEVADLSS